MCRVGSANAMAMKTILVTGGNKGIGKAICERLLMEWDDTRVILGSRDAQRGQQAVDDIVRTCTNTTPEMMQKNMNERISFLVMDTASDSSVQEAYATLTKQEGVQELYGIINNAGIAWGYTLEETINTNYFGPRRVNDAFAKLLKRPGGRIVNVASASGPNFIADLPNNNSPLKQYLAKPWTVTGGIPQLDEIARSIYQQPQMAKSITNAYGASKALLNAYTALHGKSQTDWIINSCTPGFIQTDMTKGTTASNPPSRGAIPPCYLMMDEETVPNLPTGRYYGSDCVRSPLAFYRGPGEPPYESKEDVEAVWPTAKTTSVE